MSNELLYVVIGLFIINILVNMFMIHNICDKIELVNKEVHSSNNYITEQILGIQNKKVGK